MNSLNRHNLSRIGTIWGITLISLILILVFSGCTTSSGDSSLEQTRTALSLQQTEIAEKLQENEDISSQDLQATRAVRAELGGQDTSVESKDKPPSNVTPESTEIQSTSTSAPTNTPEPTQGPDFDTWMQTASILLYEDMVGYLDTPRYVLETLNKMGLSYKDDGSAKGWLKSDLLGGPPGGGSWDLVIIASEAKSGVQGEFFQYVNDALDQGSSVIMEVWYLDQTFNGTASTLLKRCGVEFQSDWEEVPPSAMVMFPTGSQHPILFEPNSLSFTKVIDYWWDPEGDTIYDIGDRVQLAPGGDAQLLVGTHPNYQNTHGTLTVCIENRLILQTFSSHQLNMETMTHAWENYILYALKTRFENLE